MLQHPIRNLRMAAVLAALAGLNVSCLAEELPHFGTLQYESDNFEVYASEGLTACGGTYAYTENWLASFRRRVGGDAESSPYTLYWITGEDFAQSPCQADSFACAKPVEHIIYSTVSASEHEVTHLELDRWRPPSLFVEGAAELFGSISRVPRPAPLSPLFDETQIPGPAYQAAGRFSRMIVDDYGLDAYFELHRALDGREDRAAFESAVADVLDRRLEALEADFEAYAWCSVDRWRLYDYECGDLPLTAWNGDGTWAETIDLSCAADDVIGPRGGLAWSLRAFEVTELRTLRLTIDSADDTAVALVFECNADCKGPCAPAGAIRFRRIQSGLPSRRVRAGPLLDASRTRGRIGRYCRRSAGVATFAGPSEMTGAQAIQRSRFASHRRDPTVRSHSGGSF